MFRGMRYVYEVYLERSFSRAARKLYISQPSLSAAVKKEENEAGFAIFDRSTSPLQLTELGQKYIRTVEALMHIEAEFQNDIENINGLRSGSLCIGGTNLFASFILPEPLSRFTASYPAITVDLVEASTAELTEKLLTGRLDLLIDNGEMDNAVFDRQFFCKEHLILAVPQAYIPNEHAARCALKREDILCGRHLTPEAPSAPLSLFSDVPFLLLKEGNDTRTRADRLCAAAGFSPSIKLKLEQQITAYNLACHGMGAAFIGDLLLRRAQTAPGLAYYKLDDTLATRDVNFYYKHSRPMTRAVTEFPRLQQTNDEVNP